MEALNPIVKVQRYLKYGFVITELQQCVCPICRKALDAGPNYQPKYCSECGQKLDFTGIEWKPEKEIGYIDRENGNGKEKLSQVG